MWPVVKKFFLTAEPHFAYWVGMFPAFSPFIHQKGDCDANVASFACVRFIACLMLCAPGVLGGIIHAFGFALGAALPGANRCSLGRAFGGALSGAFGGSFGGTLGRFPGRSSPQPPGSRRPPRSPRSRLCPRRNPGMRASATMPTSIASRRPPARWTDASTSPRTFSAWTTRCAPWGNGLLDQQDKYLRRVVPRCTAWAVTA